MTDQVNPPIKKAEDTFKTVAWDVTVQVVLDELKLNIWPMNLILKYFSNTLYEKVRMTFDTEAISFINVQNQSVFDKATVALKIIGQEKGVDSPEYLKARENAKDAFIKFVSFGG